MAAEKEKEDFLASLPVFFKKKATSILTLCTLIHHP